MNTSSLVVLNTQVLTLDVFLIRQQQVLNLLVVDLGVTDSDCDSLVELGTSRVLDLVDGTRHNTTVLELT